MADPLILSGPYATRDDAAIGGFKKILLNANVWKTNEFAFWVIAKVNAKHEVEFFYSAAVSDSSGNEVAAVVPQHVIVSAHCHTHPSRISTGDFSSGDKKAFIELRKTKPSIAWYLLNPRSEVRVATAESDFPAGKTLSLKDSVKP